MSSLSEFVTTEGRSAVLETIRYGDVVPRIGWLAKLKTLLAILGPGLIVLVGDNDAGAFAWRSAISAFQGRWASSSRRS